MGTITEGITALFAQNTALGSALEAQGTALGTALDEIRRKQTGTDAKLADLKTRDSTEYWKKKMMDAQRTTAIFESKFPAPDTLSLTDWPQFLATYTAALGKRKAPRVEFNLLKAALKQFKDGELRSEDSAQALMTAVHTFLCSQVGSRLVVRDTHTKYAPTHPWHKFDHVFVPASSVSSNLRRTVSWDHVVFSEQLKKDVGKSRSDAVVQLADDMTEIFRKQPNRAFVVSCRHQTCVLLLFCRTDPCTPSGGHGW